MKSSEVSDTVAPQQSKRTKNPGVRVVGGRIYDSENGKTCHQCRQKILDFTIDCKNSSKGKPCTLKFCYTCLMNRYGEKAEDVATLDDWSCPRCRDICNCSFCMKKRGHNPTGMLVQMAKAGGFSSVSDLIHVKGAENVGEYKNTMQIVSSPKKKEGAMITSPKKSGKENVFDGKTVSNIVPPLIHPPVEKKLKRKILKDIQDGNEGIYGNKKVTKGYPKKDEDVQQEEKEINVGDQNTKQSLNVKKHLKVKDSNLQDKSLDIFTPLPSGTELVTIFGIDIPKKDVGNALQFLEFCSVFGKILNLRKGQGEVVLRKLTKGRIGRRGKCSLIVQFQIQLLSFIQDDIELESSSWLKELKNCIPKSEKLEKAFECLDDKNGGYDHLDISKKLMLLNFLCDEVLGTEKVRNWIDEQNVKFDEEKKEAKEKLTAAKNKEKLLKKKMQDEIASAIIARNGVPFTILEHESFISEIKKEFIQAHGECKKIIPIDKERSDAMRIEPILRNKEGHVFWRLKSYSDNSHILLQDIGSGDDTIEESENWFQFDDEKMTVIDKHINDLRNGRLGYF